MDGPKDGKKHWIIETALLLKNDYYVGCVNSGKVSPLSTAISTECLRNLNKTSLI